MLRSMAPAPWLWACAGYNYSLFSFAGSEKWNQINDDKRRMHILCLLNNVESAKREQRMKAARALLYLTQGKNTILQRGDMVKIGKGAVTDQVKIL